MPATDFDLAKLLRPVSPEEFFLDRWEKQPLLISRNDPAYYRDLFTLRDVDDVIVFTRPKFLEPGDFQADGPPAHRYVRGWLPEEEPFPVAFYPGLAEIHQAYARGQTVIIRAMQHRWPALARLCRRLEGVFTCPLQTNLYLSPPGAQGFDAHFDTHEVFVLQIHGAKHWRLYGPDQELPRVEDKTQVSREDLGRPAEEVHLEAGDLLYIPRGHIHEAFTSASASLHLTVGVLVHRWADLLRQALEDVCARDVRFRESLPRGWMDGGAAALAGRFRELLQVLAAGAEVEEAVDALGAGFLAGLPVLPDGRFVPGPDGEGIGLDTPLGRAPGVICRVVQGDDWAALEYPGNRIEGPARVAPAFRFIARTERFTARALPDNLTPAARLVLVRRLVRERLLVVSPAPGGAVAGAP